MEEKEATACAAELIAQLKAHGDTVATCESLTAGLAASTLAEVPGASAVLKGGFITYATELKAQIIGVEVEDIERWGVVSAPTAEHMATAACLSAGADWGLSFTGVAGPDTQEGKPAGTVFVGIASSSYGVRLSTQAPVFEGERNDIRQQAVRWAFDWLRQTAAEIHAGREQA